MFPLHIYAVGGAVTFAAIYLASQAIISSERIVITDNLLLGMVANVLILLLLRLYDEIKDAENDIKLGNAGDPRYKDRPIVKGKITIHEIQSLRWFVTFFLFFTIAFTGMQVYIAFILLFFYMWLSFKWFFYPRIKNNLILAFLTHNPIAFFQAVFLMSFALIDQNVIDIPTLIWWFMLANWLPIAAWEVSRKIRLPHDETDYQTYSKLLGWKNATLLAFAFISLSLLINAYVFFSSNSSNLYIIFALFSLILLFYSKSCFGFILSPSSNKSKLQKPTENILGLINFTLIFYVLFNYDIALGRSGLAL
jgi:4-hydroxybenzoate polyprenyltransferase